MLSTHGKVVVGGALTGLALLALTAGSAFAQNAPPAATLSAPTHAQMDQMMDAVGGQGGSQRMHAAMTEAMGQDGEKLMDQMVGMMGAMQNMQGMMSAGGADAMMGGQNGQAMQDAMRRMTGQ